MKKRVWIFNHYATNMFFEKGGRHYWLAKYLIRNGYEPTIFCANTRHNRNNELVTIDKGKWKAEKSENIPFVFVNTTSYLGNGLDRIRNMYSFYRNIFSVVKEYAKIYASPDIILASSVHPLTLVAGIRIAKRFGVQCICEVRDLWPESIVAYGSLKAKSILAKLLYTGEKWIYKKADKLIFTMEGGKEYIIENGWDKEHGGPVDIKKVYHINNGVDIEDFEYNKNNYIIKDEDLEDDSLFKVVYTGSIRMVNKVGKILDAAKLITDKRVRFLIWGDGDELEHLKKRITAEKIDNVRLKGRVENKYIPYITSKAQLNIILGDCLSLYRFGPSMNKMFDYFASGKPVLITNRFGYSLVERFGAGIELENSEAEHIIDKIMYFQSISAKCYTNYCVNSQRASKEFSSEALVKKLINCIEE